MTYKTWAEKSAEVCEDAKRVLKERGWIQQGFISDEGVCLLGALYIATGHTPRTDGFGSDGYSQLLRATETRVAAVTGEPSVGLGIWNDRAGRTADDIYKVLDAVISGEAEVYK